MYSVKFVVYMVFLNFTIIARFAVLFGELFGNKTLSLLLF